KHIPEIHSFPTRRSSDLKNKYIITPNLLMLNMFSFFKSSKEKALEKLGYKTLIDSYKQKVTNKEWDNKKYKEAIDKLFNDQKAIDRKSTRLNSSHVKISY